LREGVGLACHVLNSLNINLADLKKAIEKELNRKIEKVEHCSINDITLSKETLELLEKTLRLGKKMKVEKAGTQHILISIMKEEYNIVKDFIESQGIDYSQLYEQVKRERQTALYMEEAPEYFPEEITAGFSDDDDDDDEDDDDEGYVSSARKNPSSSGSSSGSASKTASKPSSDTPVIDNFGTDLTKLAAENRLDPVVGRDKEIERLAQILSRRKKNNPVLIGEPGVGKSAIVEGLAIRINQHRISRALFGKRVVNLDMAAIVAGTKYRGQFEERIKAILGEMKKNPNIILFLDEIHTMVGAGSASGSLDAANILKPALARGEIQCIGATTLNEYRTSIEKDGALERRFQKIIVDPATADETLQILRNIKDRYEDHHNTRYTDGALEACVRLTDRYISDRNFPDKAIDALDEAGSRMHISNITVPPYIEQVEKELDKIKEEKQTAVKLQNFELAASYRDRERHLIAELDNAKAKWEEELHEHRETVDEEKVAEVVAMMSGVPVQRIAKSENVRLLEMEDVLKKKVVGQDEAVHKIVKAIQRNRIGLKDPGKPVGTFMFLGPTGVGKTYLTKMLAEYMFGSADSLIRIDMSEYMEKFAVSRLIGAPPGYVGYEEGGQLTEKVRRRPYSIVLLDEMEKAHPDVFNLLLQAFDEGHLTDSLGRKIDFKNTILIMTSNIGTRQLKDFGRGIGFKTSSSNETDREFAHSIIQKALNKAFAPEFLNRVDDVIIFDQLEKDSIRKIIDIELAKVFERIQVAGYKVDMTEAAKDFLVTKGYDVQYGARPLKRAIQKYVEDELSDSILRAEFSPADTLVLDYDKGSDKIIHKTVNP